MIKQLWQLGHTQRWRTYVQVVGQWLAEMLIVTLLCLLTYQVATESWSPIVLALFGIQLIVVVIYTFAVADHLSNRWAQAASKDLQDRFFHYYLTDNRVDTGQTMKVIHQDLATIKGLAVFYNTIIPTTLQLILTGIVMVVTVLYIHPLTVLIPLLGIVVLGAGMGLLEGLGNKKNLAYIDSFNHMGERFLDDFAGMKTLIMYGRQKRYARNFAQDSETFRQKTMGVLVYQLQTLTIMDFCLYGALGWFVVAQGIAVHQQALTLPEATLISTLVSIWLIDFRKFGYFIHIFMSLLPKVKHLFDLTQDAPKTVSVKSTGSRLDPQIVRFTGDLGYEFPLVKHVDLTLQKGTVTGLAGPSGSGKSTLAAVLMKQLAPLAGTVTVDNVDLATIDQRDWWATAAYLGPTTVLFDGTIADNILLSRPDAQNWESQLADWHLCQFVQDLPDGYHTQVGENGNRLSQGQRQQIALARAVIADKTVYVFDEITANVDVANAELMLQAITQLAKNKIVLLITHRLDDIEHLSLVNLIDNNQLIAGTPAQLTQKVPAFKALLDQQSALLKEVHA